jgi:hypothetical protein
MKFRKKPVVIEAVAVSDIINNPINTIPKWVNLAIVNKTIQIDSDHIKINTLEGVMVADYDDWLIQGVNGELYPCKPDNFNKTYDKAE